MKTLLFPLIHTPMTHMVRNTVISFLFIVTSAVYGGVPSMNVTVSDASGKVAFKGVTAANGTFATGNLKPGNYAVQFDSRSAAVKGNHYLLVVSAAQRKVIADSVPGEKLTGGGVAMRINVEAGWKLVGQVAREETVTAKGNPRVKVINGKRYFWVAAETGSNLGGHWVEEGSAQARNVVHWSNDTLRKMQDRVFEGSMLDQPDMGH